MYGHILQNKTKQEKPFVYLKFNLALLSAAFDTLDVTLLCKKLVLYGFDKRAVQWFNSFLNNRRQNERLLLVTFQTRFYGNFDFLGN